MMRRLKQAAQREWISVKQYPKTYATAGILLLGILITIGLGISKLWGLI